MTPSPLISPGYTATEARLLTELVDELHAFVTMADWEQQLPTEASRSFVLERHGNPVRLTLRLYRYVSARSGQVEIKLRLDVFIQGTGREKWASADSGFFVSHGSAQQVRAAILALKADISPLQAKLAEDYRGTFYNA